LLKAGAWQPFSYYFYRRLAMKKAFLPLEALRRCVSVSSKGPEEAPKPRKRGLPPQAQEASPISGERTTRASASNAQSLLPESQPNFAVPSTAQASTNTQGRAAPTFSSPAQSLLVPALSRSASASPTQPPGQCMLMPPCSHPPLRPHAHHVSGIITPSAVALNRSGYGVAEKRPPDLVRHVYFAPSPMNSVVEITPYSKVYGVHPDLIEFHCEGMQLIDGSNNFPLVGT